MERGRANKLKALKIREDAEVDIDVGWGSRGKLMQEEQEECGQKDNRFRKKDRQSNKR